MISTRTRMIPVRNWCLGLTVLTMIAGVAQGAPASPTASVRETIEAVLSTITDDSRDASGKRDHAVAVIDERFDFREMTQRVLATHWELANAEQQNILTDLFRDRLIRAYWRKIAAYRDERFEYLPERFRTPTLATVRTIIHTARGRIPVDFKLALRAARWVAYDVIIEQTSLVRNYRHRFHDVIRTSGVDGLIADLQAAGAGEPVARE